MKLSRTVAYALQATLMLAAANVKTPVPCSTLASEGGMPERFLLQILRNLVNHGVLSSTRGIEGGYRLARSADEISLLDVIEAIDGKLEADVPASESWSGAVQVRLAEVVSSITSDVKQRLEAVKISSLLTGGDSLSTAGAVRRLESASD